MNNQTCSHNEVLQQGDTILIPIKKMENGFEPIKKDKDIIAYGELTGHSHKLEGGEFTIFENGKTTERTLNVVKTTSYRHDEHKAFDVPPGLYRIGTVRQWDYETEESKKVVD